MKLSKMRAKTRGFFKRTYATVRFRNGSFARPTVAVIRGRAFTETQAAKQVSA